MPSPRENPEAGGLRHAEQFLLIKQYFFRCADSNYISLTRIGIKTAIGRDS
jgi:hypothetical protein